jgi:hypothetical protein
MFEPNTAFTSFLPTVILIFYWQLKNLSRNSIEIVLKYIFQIIMVGLVYKIGILDNNLKYQVGVL